MVEQTEAERADDTGVHVRIGGRQLSVALSEEHAVAIKALAQRIGREPFTKRPWSELAFFLVSGGLAVLGLAFVGFTMLAGVVLAITFFGLALLALSLRSARGMGGWQRGLARSMLGEAVEDPEPFAGRRGFLGWLQSSLRDRVGWRAVAYFAIKVPWTILGVFVAVSLWWDALACLTGPILSRGGGGLAVWGLIRGIFPGAEFWLQEGGFLHGVGVFILGAIFFFAAPWVTRGFVNVDRLLIRGLLGPDPMAARVRTLEHARTQTVDASAATLRRIERDLHDGTQAQLVALAMRLGMAKEKLEDADHVDLVQRARARRRGPPRRQGGHRRAARHRPGHPPAGARHRPGGRADHAGRSQRRPDPDLLRPAVAPDPRH